MVAAIASSKSIQPLINASFFIRAVIACPFITRSLPILIDSHVQKIEWLSFRAASHATLFKVNDVVKSIVFLIQER
ncbi:hypothetical protein ccbrp13_09320 [Ktedonobacteria bacterium brp13]|nr:hypothetical protein ccbrp13_09320 [Ktedonobacteria bacterium brp13]